jgi:hypothetical protein
MIDDDPTARVLAPLPDQRPRGVDDSAGSDDRGTSPALLAKGLADLEMTVPGYLPVKAADKVRVLERDVVVVHPGRFAVPHHRAGPTVASIEVGVLSAGSRGNPA